MQVSIAYAYTIMWNCIMMMFVFSAMCDGFFPVTCFIFLITCSDITKTMCSAVCRCVIWLQWHNICIWSNSKWKDAYYGGLLLKELCAFSALTLLGWASGRASSL